ncbi:ABC transporter ATP-binding protein (plasmid) [Aminobacter sp. NyZ550]|jgi:branched-chain amino acid transport system ATP-binding protein|uniref:Branched-chain amino acid ABC transporter substrate-binding protein n=2 Tax=Aminobacter TaxID=31988 RepID=A0AAC8YUY3_AMIAI|nr:MULTISPECIES: ABC transporter ATP-binding protein [Aminobacter]AMS44648.1 branched-chain amino acid ABC transporter substrate-binding protein [Aminobacter aminovorans]MBA8906881.1 branched-chain amino acid transport system ATP-binding protein [Aminobacter ciceronei]MBA9020861.1 branched-chain amino acid transport system ATP-binding protein [Aminobacter ciceronei]MBB3708422.1 branched-chain amino acid transport system ATP-binding protein [Aminobacter aminovorans]QOF74654.1 ABC transporter AT
MAEPILEIRDLRKTFGALKATDGVSLELRPGEIHALIGPNGAGKSTLIHQISGSLRPDSGSIRFLGQDMAGLDMAARARLGLGRSFQISSLAQEFSALRNVMLAVQARQGTSFRFLRPVMSDKSLTEPAMAMLERVGLAGRAHLPAAELSHGERRQLEIAIALALGSKAFLFDEPMAGMGPEGSKALTRFLDGLRHEAPILLVEHDMDAVFALADRISVLVYGRVIATGTVDQIRNDPEVRRAYLGEAA